jgi:hypothetical protein
MADQKLEGAETAPATPLGEDGKKAPDRQGLTDEGLRPTQGVDPVTQAPITAPASTIGWSEAEHLPTPPIVGPNAPPPRKPFLPPDRSDDSCHES